MEVKRTYTLWSDGKCIKLWHGKDFTFEVTASNNDRAKKAANKLVEEMQSMSYRNAGPDDDVPELEIKSINRVGEKLVPISIRPKSKKASK